MPGVSWHINMAFIEGQRLLHGEFTAEDVLWSAKIDPELMKDAEHFKATGDYDIADIYCRNRIVTSKQAVQELQKRGHKNVNEDSFRMRKA